MDNLIYAHHPRRPTGDDRRQPGAAGRRRLAPGSRPLLTAAEEQALSRELRAAEVRAWTRLLARPALALKVLDLVSGMLRRTPPEVTALAELARLVQARRSLESRRQYVRASQVTASAVREADLDRDALSASVALVGRLAAGHGPLPRGVSRRGLPQLHAELRQLDRRAIRARNTFAEANLRLVISVVRRFRGSTLSQEDLIQEGNLGLLRATGRFDPDRGVRFSTYAVWWIRHAITRALADRGPVIRLPVHTHERLRQLAFVSGQLAARLGREHTSEELAAVLGLSTHQLYHALQSPRVSRSLEQGLSDDVPGCLSDLLPHPDPWPPDRRLEQAQVYHQVERSMARLDPREQDVLRQRFGLGGSPPRTYEQIGVAFGVSRERVRQILNRALDKLRCGLRWRQVV